MIESAELLVAEASPQVPTRNRAERPPFLTQALRTEWPSVDLRDGPLKSNITYGKLIGISKNHDAKDGDRPRTDALDTGESVLPGSSLPDLCENVLRLPHYRYTALGSALRKPHRAQACEVRNRIGDRC
jgi:hypothetical protein